MPEDDLPRLVYADWLEERGQGPRSEFIRLQIELARWSPDKAPAEGHEALRVRERELLASHAANWLLPSPTPFPPVVADPEQTGWGLKAQTRPGDRYIPVEFRRGFPDKVFCTLADWWGGECGRCGGAGRLSWAEVPPSPSRAPNDPLCDSCHGRSATAIGPAVVRSHPVEAVRLTDKSPHWNGRAYCWFVRGRSRPSDDVPEAAELPEPLVTGVHVQALQAGADATWIPDRAVGFPTADAAHAHLSRALLEASNDK